MDSCREHLETSGTDAATTSRASSVAAVLDPQQGGSDIENILPDDLIDTRKGFIVSKIDGLLRGISIQPVAKFVLDGLSAIGQIVEPQFQLFCKGLVICHYLKPILHAVKPQTLGDG